jgi:hypothetical protein
MEEIKKNSSNHEVKNWAKNTFENQKIKNIAAQDRR